LDFTGTTIVNVALPPIREHPGFPAGSPQWVISGYLLTHGGFPMPSGRAAGLLADGGCCSPEPGAVMILPAVPPARNPCQLGGLAGRFRLSRRAWLAELLVRRVWSL
jgi:hypothetical protein